MTDEKRRELLCELIELIVGYRKNATAEEIVSDMDREISEAGFVLLPAGADVVREVTRQAKLVQRTKDAAILRSMKMPNTGTATSGAYNGALEGGAEAIEKQE